MAESRLNRGNWTLRYQPPAISMRALAPLARLLDQQRPITEKHLRALSGDPNAPHTWKAFPVQGAARPTDVESEVETSLDPREQIDEGIARIKADVADQLLNRLLDQDWAFFEKAVLDLLIGMGYGGAEGSALHTRLAKDGGIDGVIDQDALGLSRIYVQAKRYGPDNIVGRPAIQGFVGALAGNQASQGVFITTSRYSADAISYADSVPTRVVLIDGGRLTRLMIRFGVDVQVKQTLHVVEVDEDFFE